MKSKRVSRNRLPPLALAFLLTLALGSFSLVPRVSGNLRLAAAFWGVTGALLIVWFLLRRRIAAAGRTLSYEFVAVKVHWVQPLMQGCVYVYWGMYWPQVAHFAPLIVAQLLFAYVLDMLVTWWRRDKWILGFGPFPIILSTNLFLWFRDDWFFLQFLMVATGVLGKEFIKWERDGRRTHIFNPSALSLFIFSVGLIVTHSTDISWGEQIATTLANPTHIYLEIFLVGLVVQALFSVTLVTLSAGAVLFALGLAYTRMTGVYNFVDSNIPASVFLGLHLLVTDPATSPRTTPGKIIFGGLYGAGVFGLYASLAWLGVPRFYDKLLCVPALNLSVRALDRWSRAAMAKFGSPAWISAWTPRQANLVHMTLWISLFTVMMTTGFLTTAKGHPGGHVEFWDKACESGKLNGCREWVHALNVTCRNGAAVACVSLGDLQQQGRLVPRDPLKAGKSFGHACDLGFKPGCSSLAEFVQRGGLEVFSGACDRGDGVSCFILGWQMDKGMGVPYDPARAVSLFRRSCTDGWARGCGVLGECYRQGEGTEADPVQAVENYEKACDGGHAPSCANAAMMYRRGMGVMSNEILAEQRLSRACELGLKPACQPGETPGALTSVSNAEASGRGGSSSSSQF
jgi:Sel1 repeat